MATRWTGSDLVRWRNDSTKPFQFGSPILDLLIGLRSETLWARWLIPQEASILRGYIWPKLSLFLRIQNVIAKSQFCLLHSSNKEDIVEGLWTGASWPPSWLWSRSWSCWLCSSCSMSSRFCHLGDFEFTLNEISEYLVERGKRALV